jgi:hypothetical protein
MSKVGHGDQEADDMDNQVITLTHAAAFRPKECAVWLV